MIDPWGDEMIPAGKPKVWGRLPLDQRAEDIMKVVQGHTSLGPNKDEAIRKYHEELGGNPVRTAEIMSEMMDNGDLPHFLKYENKPGAILPGRGGMPV
jgi:hypothetical protein